MDRQVRKGGEFSGLEGLGLALNPPCVFFYDTKLSCRTINIAFTECLEKVVLVFLALPAQPRPSPWLGFPVHVLSSAGFLPQPNPRWSTPNEALLPPSKQGIIASYFMCMDLLFTQSAIRCFTLSCQKLQIYFSPPCSVNTYS